MVPRELVQAQVVLHRQHELGEQLAGVLADDGGARMRSLPGAVSTLTKPRLAPSAIARSSSSSP